MHCKNNISLASVRFSTGYIKLYKDREVINDDRTTYKFDYAMP